MYRGIFEFFALHHLRTTIELRCIVIYLVTGPYVKRIFLDELKTDEKSVVNATPLPDFGGGHPDPNLTYAAELVEALRNDDYDFGAAFDGDGVNVKLYTCRDLYVCTGWCRTMLMILALVVHLRGKNEQGIGKTVKNIHAYAYAYAYANALNLRRVRVQLGLFGNLYAFELSFLQRR